MGAYAPLFLYGNKKMKASVLIADILSEVTLASAEQPVQPVDSNTVIRRLNSFASELSARGVSLGWTSIQSPNDDITIPDSATDGFIYNVAARLLNSYNMPLTAELERARRESEKTLFLLGVKVKSSRYPDTLPIGSGNEYCDYGGYNKFYPTSEEEILTEQGETIGLEK